MSENCRLCLVKLETKSVATPITDDEFREKLDKVFQFMIFTDETHPGQACQMCHSLVLRFYDFSLQVEENQQELWAQRLHIKVEDADVDIDNVNHLFYHVDVDALTPVSVKQEPTESSGDNDGYIGYQDSKGSDDLYTIDLPHKPNGHAYEDVAIAAENGATTRSSSTTATTAAAGANSNNIQHRKFPRGMVKANNRVPQPKRRTTLYEETEKDQLLKEFYNFQCEVCSAKLGNLNILRSHYRIKHGMEGFIRCCGKRWYDRYLMQDHMDDHLGMQPTCKICNSKHKNNRSLKLHMANYHGSMSEERPFKCAVCREAFHTKHLLRVHEAYHSTEKCLLCGKVLLSKSVKTHMAKMHNSLGKYTCDVCGIMFCTKQTFLEHKKNVHVEIDTFKCKFCGKQFVRKGSLRNHMASHGS